MNKGTELLTYPLRFFAAFFLPLLAFGGIGTCTGGGCPLTLIRTLGTKLVLI